MEILHQFIIGTVYTEEEVQSIPWKMLGDPLCRLAFIFNITVKGHMGKVNL